MLAFSAIVLGFLRNSRCSTGDGSKLALRPTQNQTAGVSGELEFRIKAFNPVYLGPTDVFDGPEWKCTKSNQISNSFWNTLPPVTVISVVMVSEKQEQNLD